MLLSSNFESFLDLESIFSIKITIFNDFLVVGQLDYVDDAAAIDFNFAGSGLFGIRLGGPANQVSLRPHLDPGYPSPSSH